MDGWNAEAIIAAIRSRGITLQELGRRHGLGTGAISATIQKPNRRGERVIARFLGVPAHLLWPARYNSDGSRREPQPASNYTPRPRFSRARASR